MGKPLAHDGGVGGWRSLPRGRVGGHMYIYIYKGREIWNCRERWRWEKDSEIERERENVRKDEFWSILYGVYNVYSIRYV